MTPKHILFYAATFVFSVLILGLPFSALLSVIIAKATAFTSFVLFILSPAIFGPFFPHDPYI
jgi:hypothetical protein